MPIRLAAAAVAAWCLLAAQTAPKVKKTTVTATSPGSGKDMYLHYCASCHGKDGKGDGPASPAMKTSPTDLRKLTSKNNGRSPDVQVARVIEGRDDLAAHGSREMPIWGQVFHQMDSHTANLRVANLTEYLQSIQGK